MHLSLRTLGHGTNSSFSIIESKAPCMFASCAILRRQHFLIRSLRGYKSQNFTETMAETKYSVDEAVAGKILRTITPGLDPGRYKGQAGKIAVIGGCREYTGAPYFAAISALKIECVSEIITAARCSKIPIVVDGDGLFLVTSNLELIQGYPLAVLTPNVNEYKRLVEKVLGGEVNSEDGLKQLQLVAQKIGVTILQKGNSDIISDGRSVMMVNIFGSPRRCGGQGDILSGSVAVFSSWARLVLETQKEPDDSIPMNPMVLGSISGSVLLRKAASLAFDMKKRSTLTTDIIEYLGESLELLSPVS